MSLLGGIQVRIGADTSGLESGMKRAGVTIKRGAQQITESAKKYAKWGAAVSAAAAAAAAAIYRSTSQQIDQLAKTSDRLGIATEQLQALQFAAEQTGVETRTLEMGLQRMTRRVSEAAQGSGEAKDAIAELGLSAQVLSRMSPDQQFRAIAGAMEQVSGQGDKVRLAMRLFDSEGVALVNTLKGGTEALDAFADRAEELGLSISRLDAARVEAANDALNEASNLIQGKLQQAVVEIAPFVEALTDEFLAMGTGVDDVGETALNTVESVAKGTAIVADAVFSVRKALANLEAAYEGLRVIGIKVTVDLLNQFQGMAQSIIDSVNSIIKATNEFLNTDFSPLKNNASQVTQEWNNRLIEASDSLFEARNRARELGEQEMPSEKISAWVENVKTGMREAQESMDFAAKLDSLKIPTSGGGGGEDNELGLLSEKQKKQLEMTREHQENLAKLAQEAKEKEAQGKYSPEQNEQFLEGLRERFATEAEIQGMKLQEDMDRLKEAKDQQLITEAQFNERKEQLASKHVNNMVKLAEIEKKSKLDAMSTMFGNLSSLMNSGNKKLFAIGKAAAIADATINAYKGIAKTMAEYPYPLNIGMAAAHGVAAFAQISNIKSQQFGSGGGSPNVYDGGQPAVNTTSGGVQPQQGGGQGSGRNISISLQGSSFTDEQVRDLIGRINDQAGDGVTLATSS